VPNDLLYELGSGLAYGAVGIVLMTLGFLLVDVLTPGRLGDLIWTQRNGNAARVLSSGLLGVGAIVTTAILTSEEGLVAGLVSTGAYGLLGLALMAVAFFVLDVVTPGRLGALVADAEPHPASWVTGASNLAIAAIISAAIS